MIGHVQTVSIYVSDQDRALDFYAKSLGFDVRRDEPFGPGLRWLEVAPPGGETSIVLAHGYGHDDWQARIGTFTGIVLATDDIRATYEELHGRGVSFSEAPELQPWGMWQAQFVDQDGNGFVLVQVTP